MGTGTDVGRSLHAEVAALCARVSRRVFDATVYVGTPGGERDSFVVRAGDLPAIDRAARVDIVAALVDRLGRAHTSAWLTRAGAPETCDGDVAWMTAAGAAYAIHGRTLTGFWVVTPTGWCDVLAGERRL